MPDDFDRIKSALSDITRAVRALRGHPERDFVLHLNEIDRAANVITKNARDAEHDLNRAVLAERRRNYAP